MSLGPNEEAVPLKSFDYTKEFNEIIDMWDVVPGDPYKREKVEEIVKKRLAEKDKVIALRITLEHSVAGDVFTIWLKLGYFNDKSLHLYYENCAFIMENHEPPKLFREKLIIISDS